MKKIVFFVLKFSVLEETPFDFGCGSFPTLQCFDNGDSDFIHQEFLLLSMTTRESEGNTLHLKHVVLWDSTIRITGLISSPLGNGAFTMEARKKKKISLKNKLTKYKTKFYMHVKCTFHLLKLYYSFMISPQVLFSSCIKKL